MQYPLSDPTANLAANKFTDGKVVGGIPASPDRAAYMNACFDEIIAVITAAGLTPSEANNTQLASAISTLIAAQAGNVVTWPAATPPSGHLECNGAAINRTTYASLFAAIGTTFGVGDGATTFNIPDLRGEFIRGWDHGRGIDVGRVLGSFQADAFKSHTHNFTAITPGGSYGAFSNTNGPATAATTATGGSETRPRNIAMMFAIKY